MTEAWKKWEGQVVNGEFRLRQYLGGSDHGAVFLTEYGERGLQRAAIKLVPADPQSADLQLSRWGLAAKLSHPHLIRLLQTGRCQLDKTGLLFVVMEYADENLAQIVPHRPLTPAEARDMLEPALDALAYLHTQGFVHGHVKPANIMAVNDQLKLSSDGLYRRGETSASPEKTSIYDPPEKADGTILAAGDVWSLGVALAEAMTKRLPTWNATELGDPSLPATLPAPFFDIARNCLRRDPQRRLTVADIAARLHQTQPAPRERVVVTPQAAYTKRRFIVPAAVVAVVVVAMLAGPRLLHRSPDTQQAASVAPEPPKPQESASVVEQKPAAHEPVPPKATIKETTQISRKTSPLPVSSRTRMEASSSTVGSVENEEVVQQILPHVPQSASDTIRGTVKVKIKVQVDRSGSVVGADFDSRGPSQYFARLAMQSAQSWKFTPSQDASREWILRFEFRKTGTKAFAVKLSA
jgi:serine/threonine protein kinase